VSETHAAEADLAASRLVISTAVASMYFQLQSNTAQLKLAEEMQHQQESLLTISRTLTHRQINSDIPLATTMANLETAKINVAEAKQAMLMARYQLAALVGKNPFTTEITLAPFHYQKQMLTLPANLPANLLARRPDIVASRWRVEAAQHNVNSTKARFYPNINLSALYSYQSIGLGVLFRGKSRDIAGQAAFDLTIFDAGYIRANLKTRNAEYDMAVNQYNQSILTALRQTANQLTILQSVKSQLASQAELIHASQRRYTLTRARYNHGIDTYTPVLQNKIALLRQQRIQLQMQTQHTLAIIGMIKVLGGDYQPREG
jgi:NodT family efflux transporter outer membrane factor (OMF) lipoprotein